MFIVYISITLLVAARLAFDIRSRHRASYLGEMDWFFKENRSTLDKIEVFFRYTLTFDSAKRLIAKTIPRLSKYYWRKFLVKRFGRTVYSVDTWSGLSKHTVLVFDFNKGYYFSEGKYKFSNVHPIKQETFIDMEMAIVCLMTLQKLEELKTL